MIDEGLNLSIVLLGVACCRRWRDGPSCELCICAFMAKFSQEVAEARLYEGPCALVLRLFLEPLNFGVGVTLERRLNRTEGERC